MKILFLIFISTTLLADQISDEKWCKKETLSHLLDEEKFLHKIQSSPPGWMEEQIAEDFSNFLSKGISKTQVDETFSQIRKTLPHPRIIRYRIINNELYRFFPEEEPISLADNNIEKALKTLLHYCSFKDIDFILSYFDGIPHRKLPNDFHITANKELQAPILFSAKKKAVPHIILIPDWRSVSDWWASDISTILPLMKKIPWEKKKDFALWRGSLTKAIRLKLCEISSQNPTFIDAKLNQKVSDPLRQEDLGKKGFYGQRVSWEEFLQSKYAFTVDGVCCAAPAVQWRLLSNSVTFKQESDEIQWFYRAIQPNIHYIPLKNDLSNLVDKIEWAKQNDSLCREIADRSTEFALNHLMMEDVYLYFSLVLKKYGSVQNLNRRVVEKEMKKNPNWVNIHYRKS